MSCFFCHAYQELKALADPLGDAPEFCDECEARYGQSLMYSDDLRSAILTAHSHSDWEEWERETFCTEHKLVEKIRQDPMTLRNVLKRVEAS